MNEGKNNHLYIYIFSWFENNSRFLYFLNNNREENKTRVICKYRLLFFFSKSKLKYVSKYILCFLFFRIPITNSWDLVTHRYKIIIIIIISTTITITEKLVIKYLSCLFELMINLFENFLFSRVKRFLFHSFVLLQNYNFINEKRKKNEKVQIQIKCLYFEIINWKKE